MFTWRFTGYGRSHGVVTPSFLRVNEGTRYKNKKSKPGEEAFHLLTNGQKESSLFLKKKKRLRNKKSKPFPSELCLIWRIMNVTY